MKKNTFSILVLFICLTGLMFSCVKTLEDEGIYSTTEYIGTVVEKSTMQPIKDVKVQVTDGTHVHASTITDNQGSFSLKDINFEEVDKDYYLWLDGTALDLPCAQEELMGLGRKIFDYKTLVLYDKTNATLLPVVTTEDISDIAALSTKVSGNVTADGGHDVTVRGICYATHQVPTLEDSVSTSGAGKGKYTCTLSGLSKSTTYYVRAFATNSIGTVYGAQKTFTTQSGVATITTIDASQVKHNSAIVGGNISADGGDAITARGICWGTTANPTLENNHTTDGNGTGSFTHTLQGLLLATTYYYRAYATNSCGTTYGTQKSFTTKSGLPELTTTSQTNVTATSAKCGGNITDNGGFTVTTRGICWNTGGNPDTNDAHKSSGSGNGSFTVNMTNLNVGTTYHVRAYAVNQKGIAYGNEIHFTTESGMPTVTTSAATSVTAVSAVCNGSVTGDGGFAITAKGFCWGTVQYPTINEQHNNLGTGTGTLTSSITGLTRNTTYYVRAYATNANGTSYGSQISFTTSSGLPTVTTSASTSVTDVSAVCNGNVTSDGGFSVTAKGFCWSTTQMPTISGQHNNLGTGTGTMTGSITGLSRSTTYYVRAYATNTNGTVYGSQISLTTTSGLPTVTTTAVTMNSGQAVSGGNVTSDGGHSVTARGICYGVYPNPDLTSAYTHTSNGTGTGYFTSLISSSISGTFYVRAYATNSVGTVYGNQITSNMDYLALPTFVHNGHTYRVAPDPGVYMDWTTANSYCSNLSLYGYTDWRMPTDAELQMMCTEKTSIGGFYIGDGWSNYGVYWSSTIESYNEYQCVYFYDCLNGSMLSSGAARVRPIRMEN